MKKKTRNKVFPFILSLALILPLLQSAEETAWAADRVSSARSIGTIRVEPEITDFRFWTVAGVPAVATEDLQIFESKSESARAVGSLVNKGGLYILEDTGDGWPYVESGEVRGFVSADVIRTETAGTSTIMKAPTARKLISQTENAAFTYLRATTKKVLADAIYAIAKENGVSVYEDDDENSRCVGNMRKGDLCCVLEGVARVDETEIGELRRGTEEDASGEEEPEGASPVSEERMYTIIGCGEWLYIESGDVRGFVKSSAVRVDDKVQSEVRTNGADSYDTASLSVPVKDNKALYHTMRSTIAGVPEGKIRDSIARFATQFINTPYVSGGTDLVNGTDSDGLIWALYAQYGYYLPRLADRQVNVGSDVTGLSRLPGDLLFFRSGEDAADRVAICVGNGQMVEASREMEKVVLTPIDESYFRAARIIADELYSTIPSVYNGYPVGTNNCYTVTHNYGTRKWADPCRRIYRKWVEAGSVYTENVATIDDYCLIACTSLFGTVGDVIIWRFDDGSTLNTIMADTKSSSDPNYTIWGHITGKVINVLEFETDALIHPGTAGCIPRIAGKRVTGWTNLGRVF